MRIFVRFLLLVVLLVSLGVIAYRAVYDFNLIRKGDTIVVKKSSPEGYDYLLRIPRGYNDYSGPQPLLIFLHGSGETGTDPTTLLKSDPTTYVEHKFRGQETSYFPFIIVTPICPEKRWEPSRVIALLDQVLKENRFRFKIDPDRIYLTGYSMGGFGTIETAMEYPDRFAAIVPVAGGGEPSKAEKLQNVSAWFFHGAEDKTVPLPSSELLVDRMRELGHKDVALRIIPHTGHGIAGQVYSNESLYRWLLLKRKSRFGSNETLDKNALPPKRPEPEKEKEEPETTDQKPDSDPGDHLERVDATERKLQPATAPSGSLDDGAGGDPGDLVDGGPAAENLADPVVPEELHPE